MIAPHRSSTSFAIALALVVLTAAPARSAVGWWSSQGPPGGEVSDLAALAPGGPGLLAATYGGVFSSGDGGDSWVGTSHGLGFKWVSAVAADPSDAARAYAATYEGGVIYRSLDGGRTWAALPSREGFVTFHLAIAGSSPARLYAGGTSGVLRSDDRGLTWTDASVGLGGAQVRALEVFPGDANTVWVVTYDGVYRSVDGGGSWSHCATPPRSLGALALDPHLAAVAWAGTQLGVVRSTDAGATWNPRGLVGREVNAVAVDPEAGTVWAATPEGVLRSSDDGLSWQPAGSAAARALLVGASGAVWAITDAGVVRWNEATAEWQPAIAGMVATRVNGVTTLPGSWVAWVAVEGAGVFESRDGGASWQERNSGITDRHGISIYAVPGTTDVYYGSMGEAFVSHDGAGTWSPIEGLLQVTAWAARPGSPRVVYAGCQWHGIWRSVDGGSFSPINVGLDSNEVLALAIDPQAPLSMWAGTMAGVFRSVDGGDHWTASSAGLLDLTVRALVAAPGGILLAGTSANGVFRSTDGGATWQQVYGAGQLTQVYTLARCGDGRLYAGGAFGVVVSADGGVSWTPLAAIDELVLAVAVDGLYADRLYAGGLGTGVSDLDTSAPAEHLSSPSLPGFSFSVRITSSGGERPATRQESDCIAETVCISGALPGRAELFLRVIGPRPNGYLWPVVVKFTTSRIEVWVEQTSTGIRRHYLLREAGRDSTDLTGFYDRAGFLP